MGDKPARAVRVLRFCPCVFGPYVTHGMSLHQHAPHKSLPSTILRPHAPPVFNTSAKPQRKSERRHTAQAARLLARQPPTRCLRDLLHNTWPLPQASSKREAEERGVSSSGRLSSGPVACSPATWGHANAAATLSASSPGGPPLSAAAASRRCGPTHRPHAPLPCSRHERRSAHRHACCQRRGQRRCRGAGGKQ